MRGICGRAQGSGVRKAEAISKMASTAPARLCYKHNSLLSFPIILPSKFLCPAQNLENKKKQLGLWPDYTLVNTVDAGSIPGRCADFPPLHCMSGICSPPASCPVLAWSFYPRI